MTNRLGQATSLYLLHHAQNPIDWWEWSDEAFAEAQRRNVPVLLSIGYAACHWCHAMAHESFSDPEIADRVNANFVAIKVDREERPDVDAVYMAATQSMTGRGGWPMTCFLTPGGEPFHCGTYYPPEPRSGLPSFRQMLTAVTTAWTSDGDRVRDAAKQIAASLGQAANAERPAVRVGPSVLDHAAHTLVTEFDAVNGGFGSAPKFPPALCLEFLLRYHERTGSARALQIVELTCERMARGAIYDQLQGGFARYTVDEAWVVPHFEKMLYDNALLLRVYVHLTRRTGSALAERVVAETAEFLLAHMRTAEGAFASALDADTNGVEGLTYLWSPSQVIATLGLREGSWAADLLEVTSAGTFEGRLSTLQLLHDPEDWERWRRVRATLRHARRGRPQPACDDKVVTAWNGMAAAALAEAGVTFSQPQWVAAAGEATDFLLAEHLIDGRLRRSSRQRRSGTGAAVLEDHAWLAEALLALHQATGDPNRLDTAVAVLDLALEHFEDPDRAGVLFDTADDTYTLLHRPRDIVDNATPSGGSALAGALLTASVLTDATRSGRYRELAEAAVASVGQTVGPHARFAGHWLTTAEALAHGPVHVAVVGDLRDPTLEDLLARARKRAPGGSVIVHCPTDASGAVSVPDHPRLDGRATAYVCRGFLCEPAVGAPDELERLLTGVFGPAGSGTRR